MSHTTACQANTADPRRSRRSRPCGNVATWVQFWRSGEGGRVLLVCAECAAKRSPVCKLPSDLANAAGPGAFRVRYIFHRGDEGLAHVERDAGVGPRAWAEDARAALVAEGADAWIERSA